MNRKEGLKKVAELRARARLQAHLFSMEARERWDALEDELNSIEDNLQRNAAGALEHAVERLVGVVARADAFLERHALGCLTLLSPAEHAMTVAPVTCSPSDTLNVAAKVMWDEDCGIVPVVDAAGLLVGVITDRDICMACYTQGRAPGDTTVRSAMSSKPYGVSLEAPLSQVLALMAERRVRRIPVLSAEGRLLGIVSLADLFRHLPETRTTDDLEAALAETLVLISEKRPCRTSAIAAE